MRGKFAADSKLFVSVQVKSASPPLKPFTRSENQKRIHKVWPFRGIVKLKRNVTNVCFTFLLLS